MSRVLLISELFYPINRIGALRPSKICKYLIDRGYDIDVITAYPSEGIYNSDHCKVFPLRKASLKINNSVESTRYIKWNGKFMNQLRYLKRTVLSYRAGKKYAQKAIAIFESGTLNAEDYDACFTTYGPVSSILIGLELKRKYHIKNWICDFRDPMAVKMCSVFMFPFYKYLQNRACKYADKIIAVSNGYVRHICGNKYQKKTYMIPNGYDISDAVAVSERQKNDKLTLVYVGTLYEGKRDISPIFRALYELSAGADIDITKIKFVYAGADFANLVSQAKRYNMQQILENYGKLPRNECLKMQYDSDMLVLSTWNNKGEEGVFPGKFLEYMLMGRPIISITDGNMPDSEVTSVMREGKFGIAYESIHNKEDRVALKEYIKSCYYEWLQKGYITFEPVQVVLDRYNYDHIIDQIEELIHGKK